MNRIGVRVSALAIAIYFLYFAIPALRALFTPDDMMNIGRYWTNGFWGSWWADLPWAGNRPVAAGFYLPIYYLFGLNPVPYRAVILVILAANVFFTFKIVDGLTGSPAVSALAAMLGCANAGMVAIYYNTAMIYDVLAYFFTAAMLWSYIAFRRGGGDLGVARTALVILLYIAAIKSKEIAIVTAGWILGYEVLFHRPPRLRVPAILLLVSLLSLAALLSPHALAAQSGYRLDLTPHRFVVNNSLYANELFYTRFFHDWRELLFAWLLLTAICAILRRRDLWWSWFAVSTATLPVSFTVFPRDGASLYVPLLGFSILFGILAAGFFKRPGLQWTAALVIATLWSHSTIWRWRPVAQALLDDHRLTWSVIRQLHDLPHPAPHSRVIILRNPFEDFDMAFIAMLTWSDHSIDIYLANKLNHPPNPGDYNWILDFEGETLRVVKQQAQPPPV